ncbi:hypothetical protein BDF20DRAFT_862236 [Mycotypha africana]|uniref:uncharacterized protein n=1 Tax=Mycotypha africana TaxID=64632 RepID=UPI0022FFE69E|nr:uncharacterized protein BDF20DRAFT_862236 [Mycotypha africana]KAI8981630.1 hypothetical protein BDF20DRAFT_862236 [Mycotypha africana]
MKKDNQQPKQVVWSSQNVSSWLIANGWSFLVEVFKDYNIQYDRFLNLTLENVNELLKNTSVPTTEKQRLIFSIQKLKAEDKAFSFQPQQHLLIRPRIAIPAHNNYQPYKQNRKSDSILNSAGTINTTPTSTNTPTSTTSTNTNSSSPNNLHTLTLNPNHIANNYHFDITQYIPKRTSSNETNVSKMLENFHPTTNLNATSAHHHSHHHHHSNHKNKPKSPRAINATDPEILSKLFGKRLPVPQDRRIQVTLDADTFIRLWISYTSNAIDIKRAVLKKLSIDAEPSYFHFFHENGLNSTVPLNDDELVYICRTSDDNRTNHILVVPLEGYTLVRQHYQQQNNVYSVRYILTQTSPAPSPISSSSITGIQLTDPETPREDDIHYRKQHNNLSISRSNQQNAPTTPITALSSADLWATPLSTISNDTRRFSSSSSASSTLRPNTSHHQNAGSNIQYLWPVGEQRTEHTTPTTDDPSFMFEGISLYDPPTPVNDQSVHHELPTSAEPTGGSSSSSTFGNSKEDAPPSDNALGTEEPKDKIAMAFERPSIERLYRDIDKYLPGHDLDKEIIVDNLQQPVEVNPSSTAATHSIPLSAINNRRLVPHRQSVRVVAKEAHRRWKQATQHVKTVNALVRRKSTKMWDRPVERVKPGEEGRIVIPPTAAAPNNTPHIEQNDIDVNDNNNTLQTAPTNATTSPTDTLTADGVTPTKMQWMRGNLIGRGSFGRVYHALNIATGEWIVVKQVDAAVTQSDQRNADLKAASDALYREIQLLKDLDHENIVQYLGYDSNVEEGHIYIFLEYVPGGSISSLLNQYQYFDEPLTKFFTRQILQGLKYLHDRHILHRDIKGGNVLIDQNGVCKITDFGLSKNQQHDSSHGAYDPYSNHSQMKGTLYWMAPEVLTNHYSAKVDVWSLGCTVLEMITGEHPWMELTTLAALYQIGLHNAPAIPDHISDEAKDFLQLCLKM